MGEVRPVIFCSRCLGFEACRYNGEVIPAPYVEKLSLYCDITTVCPEVEIGLGVPRKSLRLVKEKERLRFIQSETNLDFTSEMEVFSEKYLDSIKCADGFILKYKSPSCGVSASKYYASMEKGAMIGKGPGLFGRSVLEKYPYHPVETETRLTNFRIREHFLLRLFTLARFREVKNSEVVKKLINFHARHKLLLLAYHQENMRKMGRLIAKQKENGLEKTIEEYERLLLGSFMRMASHNSHINVIEHAAGYFSDKISKTEREYLEKLKADYTQNKIPLSVLRALIYSYILRFDISYLKEQIYFEPYPTDLSEVTDSGKGRDLKHI